MAKRKVRKSYERVRVSFQTEGESRTHKSHAESCDVNNIVRRYERTGMMPPPQRPPSYADVTALQGDLTERIERARDIQAQARDFEQKWTKELKEKEAKEAADKAKPSSSSSSSSSTPPASQPPAGDKHVTS